MMTVGKFVQLPRRPWARVAIGAGILIALTMLILGAVVAVGRTALDMIGLHVDLAATHSWSEAASRTQLRVYQPAYLPAISGTPEIRTASLGEIAQDLTAEYPGGLTISESEGPSASGDPIEAVSVRGAERAYFDTFEGARILVVGKGDTWVLLSGLEDQELIRVAESLRPVAVP
jgi:hypothetical protein